MSKLATCPGDNVLIHSRLPPVGEEIMLVVDTVSLLSTYVPDCVNYTPHYKATIHWYINEKSEF